MNRKLNLNAFTGFVISAAYAGYIAYLIVSQKLSLYLHPKMIPYSYFTVTVLSVISIYQASQIFSEPKNRKFKKGYLIFMIPVLLALFVSPQGISSAMANNKGVYVISKSQLDSVQEASNTPSDSVSDSASDVPQIIDIIDFPKVMMEMYLSPKTYEGKTVRVHGFIYRSPDDPENSFMVSRMLVSCCAADAQVAGFKSEWDMANTLKDEGWYLIEGKVKLVSVYNPLFKSDEIISVIEVESAVETEPLENPYIYP